jgi:hypothetical protein
MKRRLTCLFYHTAFCIFFTISFHIVKSQTPAAAGIPVSDRIVLAAGAVQITEYEVRKNYLRFQQEYKSKHGHLPGPEAIKEWGVAFTDRTYILADAWDKGYFEKPAVNRAVESMSRLIIGQQGGLLEQKLLAPQAAISEAELQVAIERSRKQVIVEYLKFPNYDQALNFMGGPQPENLQVFRKAIDKCSKDVSIIHRLDTFAWPSVQLGIQEDYITGLEKGALTPVLTLPDGYYVMHVNNTAIAAMPDQQRRNNIRNILIMRRKEKARQEYFRAVRKDAGTVMNPEVLQALKNRLAQYGPLQAFDKNKFSELLSLPAITYSCNRKEIIVTTAAFMDFYNTIPLKKELASIEAVVTYMHAYVQDEYAYRKADELGITRDAQFRLDKDNYKKTVIDNLYETNELKAAIEVPEQEIRDRYENRKYDFVQAVEAVVSMRVFDTRNHAMAGRLANRSRPGAFDVIDTAHLKGILHTDLHRLVQYNELSLSDTVRKVIFSMPVGEMSRPVPFNGHYMVIVKESESGRRLKLPTEVKDILWKEIIEEKCKKKKQELVKELKEKYKLQDSLGEVLKLK